MLNRLISDCNKQIAKYNEGTRNAYPHWTDFILLPLIREIGIRLNMDYDVIGVFGSLFESYIQLLDENGNVIHSLSITPRFQKDSHTMIEGMDYDTGKKRERHRMSMNGINNIMRALPDSIDEIISIMLAKAERKMAHECEYITVTLYKEDYDISKVGFWETVMTIQNKTGIELLLKLPESDDFSRGNGEFDSIRLLAHDKIHLSWGSTGGNWFQSLMRGNYSIVKLRVVTKQLYRVETGVLLTAEDAEYEKYNHIYTQDFGFFDEGLHYELCPKEAREYGNHYIKHGVDRTYAVITSDVFLANDAELTTIVDAIVSGETEADESWNFGYDLNDILYFAYKDNDNLKVVIDKLPTIEQCLV